MKRDGIAFLFLIILVVIVIFINRGSHINPTSSPVPSVSPSTNQVLGVRTKTTGCIIQNSLPDKNCTPGATLPDVTKDQVCTPGYAKSVRNVTQETKDKVFEEYNLPPTGHQPGEYEVDHLISLELGGSNDISNLWPEAAEPTPGYHQKDQIENYLHQQVCNGSITLQQAQQQISQNWLQVYQQINQ